ncbi:hypothetical protein ACAG96_05760 [Candidatus Izemoplasma sp. B36]|uniref:hypothetical protein n=1 Tax=Candidatus Izemoplasma sp. B36 TaxID=3242468 RepID=UPI003558BC18
MNNFIWASKKPLDEIATIYEANITLNKSATGYFENAYVVLLGLDRDKKLIAIKPVTKEEISMGYIPKEQQHNITVKSSYSRICNKLFVKEVSDLVGLKFIEHHQSYKFKASWNKEENVLVIDLNKKEV